MTEITFRLARMSDAQTLLDWRNDPLTRAMSKSQDFVAIEDHLTWLERRLARVEPALFLAVMDSQLVGTFRIDGHEVSYTVSPEFRGRGVATLMLTEVRRVFGQLRAEIYARNSPSIKAATAAGLFIHLLDG